MTFPAQEPLTVKKINNISFLGVILFFSCAFIALTMLYSSATNISLFYDLNETYNWNTHPNKCSDFLVRCSSFSSGFHDFLKAIGAANSEENIYRLFFLILFIYFVSMAIKIMRCIPIGKLFFHSHFVETKPANFLGLRSALPKIRINYDNFQSVALKISVSKTKKSIFSLFRPPADDLMTAYTAYLISRNQHTIDIPVSDMTNKIEAVKCAQEIAQLTNLPYQDSITAEGSAR